MRITLVQNEIEKAISEYMDKIMKRPIGKEYEINIVATRGATGVTAELSLVDKVEKDSAKPELPTQDAITGQAETDPITAPLSEEKQNIFETKEPPKKKSFFASLE